MGGRRGGRGSGRERGADLRYNLEISARGGLRRQDRRDHASRPRSPARPAPAPAPRRARKPRTCQTCGGQGRVRHAQGFFSIERTCPTCQGRGQVIDDPCATCAGAGRVTRERTLSVNIPAGVEDGTRIRLAGEGEAGVRGGPPGDLYIFLSLEAASVLPARRRRSALPRAHLDGHGGARRRVRRADDRRRQDQGEGARGHAIGTPLPSHRQGHAGAALETDGGDMYVQVMVETPQNLTKRQKELLTEFEKHSSRDTQPGLHGLLRARQGLFRHARQPRRVGLTARDP